MAKQNMTLLGLTSFLIVCICSLSTPTGATSSSSTSKPSIQWDVQLSTPSAYFMSIGMCKGTTEATRKVGFVGGELGSIWRTLDGKNWQQVAQFPRTSYWYGIYCFPDAQRVIAVGFSNGDAHYANGALMTWSFDGGNTWTNRQSLQFFGNGPLNAVLLRPVHFYNDTHGTILPMGQDLTNFVTYSTTTGGKTPSDWKTSPLSHQIDWGQSHAIWAFGDVAKSIANNYYFPYLCSTENAGQDWQCEGMTSRSVPRACFTSPDRAIGVDYQWNVFATSDGGKTWRNVSSVPQNIANNILSLLDMVWIPNSDVVILTGGANYDGLDGSMAHSLDGGVTWTESMPSLTPTKFNSIDIAKVSDTTYEVWAVGTDKKSTSVVHATVTLG